MSTYIFDYERIAKEIGVADDKLEQLTALVRDQYGEDEMMFELRMLRSLTSVKNGRAPIDAIIAEFSKTSALEKPTA